MKTKLTLITINIGMLMAGFICAQAQTWIWTEDTLSYARTGLTAATMDDTIFYSGGKLDATGGFSNIWDIYDIGEDQWDTYETSSALRWNSATVSAGGKVFSAGGSNYPAWGNLPDVDIYDKESGEWTVEYLSLGRTLYYGGAVASGNKVFFAGGHIHTGYEPMTYTNRIDIYNTETNSWSIDSLSVPRCFIGGVAAGDKIYFAGGATGEQEVTDVIDIYDINTGEWTVDSLSEPRALIAAIAYGDKIYFVGGSKPYNVTSTLIEVYNITSGIWEEPMNLQNTRVVTALNVKNSLVFTGIFDYFAITEVGYLGPVNGVVEIYYPETNQWEYSVPNLNPARFLYAYISYGNKAYYAGGWADSGITDKISILADESYCLPEGIAFTSQSQIDNFQTNYPGCTEIEGDVEIDGSDITNLNGLNVLTSIGGNLRLTSNDALTNLMGLENLTSIGGSLYVFNNENLISLIGLENLTSIVGDLQIGLIPFFPSGGAGNNSLTSLAGLDNLTFIGGTLMIVDNNTLISLSGLENLISIEGSLRVGHVHWSGTPIGNPALINLSGLDNLNYIGEGLEIIGNNSLTNLTGLDNLVASSINNLSIHHNNLLSSCEVQSICDYLAAPTGTVNIYLNASGCNNPGEVAIACGFALPCLPYGNYYFLTQSEIDDFQSNYPGCTELEGNLHISGNDIIDLSGLSEVSAVGNDIFIEGNDILTSLSGLDNIDPGSISSLNIIHNDFLSNCEVESICDYLTNPNGEITIADNAPGCNSQYQVEELCLFSCLQEGIEFHSQLEIDNFEDNYPECVKIEGNVTISGNDIFNLKGLKNLKAIGGNLTISGNDILQSLTGFEGLNMISGDLSIADNYSLANIITLNNITSVGGIININNNYSITSLWGLQNINASSIDELKVINNASLSTCDVQSICEYLAGPNANFQISNNAAGCNSLDEIEEACESHCLYEGITFSSQEELDSFQTNHAGCSIIEGDVIIRGDDITNLNGLENLTSIDGDLHIGENKYGFNGNPLLTSIAGLNNVNTITGELSIYDNPALISLAGLENLTTIRGDFNLDYSALINLNGLNNLTFIGGDFRMHFASPISLTGLDNLTSIGGDLWLDNPGLISLAGLDNMIFVGGDIFIGRMMGTSLSNLNGLDNLVYIGGDLKIRANSNLSSLTGLQNVTSIRGNLSMYLNDILINLTGLEGLASIKGDLEIRKNNAFINFTGLNSLTSVGGKLRIWDNNSLVSLSGIEALTSIDGDLEIYENNLLQSLSGLDNISPTSINNLHIHHNDSLSSCALQSICDYLANPIGEVTIEDNGTGCNSPDEVEAACDTVSVEKIYFKDTFTIIPNPLQVDAAITYTLNESTYVTLKILDLSGREIITLVNEIQQQGEQRIDFNTSGLLAGIYFCVLKTSEGILTTKMIKL